jgi:DNA-binding MarR family transcriptional regulator
MVVHPRPAELELSLLALFAGWAMAGELQGRMATDGLGELRFNDGVVFQHVVAGPLSITTLAERMGVTQQAASKTVADLEHRGLLTRRPAPDDGRAKELVLTRRAERAVEKARHHRAALEAELDREFGAKKVADARALLAAILTRFDADDAIRHRRVRPPA